ncbi:hypothetical protein HZ989_14410 [Brevundimonas sp. AJA228-03]|uniref:hypothetical protein n=1 Tax=Brevundimonas sp. AJA228-03 TaxID=2752515 RepID=UPI001ADEDEC0|nr:hypothetical protein [Brevundimonas sp. AJA228-03]QTN19389.1 hypothetical protein HZ989_14410 [Brevundimonas sp. AJA228-03]
MRLLIAALALMASACSPMAAQAPETATQTRTAEQVCAARGGALMRVGRLQTEQCVIPFADGGKVCRDGDDCRGNCYTETAGNQPPGPVTGRCAVNDLPFGCRTPVEDGQAGPTLCVD